MITKNRYYLNYTTYCRGTAEILVSRLKGLLDLLKFIFPKGLVHFQLETGKGKAASISMLGAQN